MRDELNFDIFEIEWWKWFAPRRKSHFFLFLSRHSLSVHRTSLFVCRTNGKTYNICFVSIDATKNIIKKEGSAFGVPIVTLISYWASSLLRFIVVVGASVRYFRCSSANNGSSESNFEEALNTWRLIKLSLARETNSSVARICIGK